MKPGTFTQQYVHLVFAVKNHDAALTWNIRKRVFEYISGIITAINHKSIIVNGVSDHVHILIGLNPSISISDTVHDIKRSSSLFINKEKLCRGKFAWQEGYGGFTYSQSQLEKVYNYIQNQEIHHEKSTFKAEYIQFLKNYAIDFDDRFLFDFWNNVLPLQGIPRSYCHATILLALRAIAFQNIFINPLLIKTRFEIGYFNAENRRVYKD